MRPSTTPRPASPYRRRRILWSLSLIIVVTYIYFFTRSEDEFAWSLPITNPLKAFSGLSPANSRVSKVGEAIASDRRLMVSEIHGLLHFVTAYPDRTLNEAEGGRINVVGMGTVQVNPEETVDMRVFAPDGKDDWESHLRVLRKEHPLIVFSKTYCPYSRRAKDLLASYDLSPPPTIVELDTRPDGPVIQAILSRLTGRNTVPNVILQTKSIGGSDDIHRLDHEHQLKDILEEGGLKVQAEEKE